MGLAELILILFAVGVGLWLFNQWQAIDGRIKWIINCVVILAVAMFLIRISGLWDYVNRIKF